MNWYYVENGLQKGPIDEGALRSLIAQGIATASTLVWHEGMANWQPLSAAAPHLSPGQQPKVPLGNGQALWPEELKGPGVSFAALKARAKNGPKGNYWVYAGYMVLSQVIDLSIRWGFGLIAMIPAVTVAVASAGEGAEPDLPLSTIIPLATIIPNLISVIGGLVAGILAGPIVLGFKNLALRGADHQTLSIGDGFYGFKKFGRAFLWFLLVAIYLTLWSLLFIIPGIIKSFSYAMTPFILIDHPEMSVNQAITESRRIMNGHKRELFLLGLSFIGWWLLGFLTCGVLYLWLTPYMGITNAAFYRSLPKD